MTERPGNNKFVLEVIACSVQDAVEAQMGGADRLEIVRDLDLGGLTAPLELVREIRSKVTLPLRVMLREDTGYLASETAIEKLCHAAEELNVLGIEGVVVGFLNGRKVDIESAHKILSYAPDVRVTFHHAFEDTADKLHAIDEIKRIGQVDRILSHGGEGPPPKRAKNLDTYAAAAGPAIGILAGGRIDLEMIRELRENTNVREFHVGSAARENGSVVASRIEVLARAVRGEYD